MYNLKKYTQKDRHGNTITFEVERMQEATVPSMQEIPMYDHPGDPRGTDTVPAWLTPGEFVMNAEATRMYEPQIKAMNDHGRAVQKAQGGTIPEYHSGGGNAGYSRDAYMAELIPAAKEEAERLGVDPRIIVAQSIQETGWGQKAPGNSYFGVKSHGYKGKNVDFGTHEYENGQKVNMRDSFRGYDSLSDSVRGYGDFITSNPRYKPYMEAEGLDAQLVALGKSGYATDPNYAENLKNIISGRTFRKYYRAEGSEEPEVPMMEEVPMPVDGIVQDMAGFQRSNPNPPAPELIPTLDSGLLAMDPSNEDYPPSYEADNYAYNMSDEAYDQAMERQLDNASRDVARNGAPEVDLPWYKDVGNAWDEFRTKQRGDQADYREWYVQDLASKGYTADHPIMKQAIEMAEEAKKAQKLSADPELLTKTIRQDDIEQMYTEAVDKYNSLEKTKKQLQEKGLDTSNIDKQLDKQKGIISAAEVDTLEVLPPKPYGKPVPLKEESMSDEQVVKTFADKYGEPTDEEFNKIDKQFEDLNKQEEDPSWLDRLVSKDMQSSIGGFFSKMMGHALSDRALSALVMNYVGSRAMGYDHGASFQFAAKKYGKQIEASQALEDKLYLSGKYKAPSIKRAMEKGDFGELVLAKSGMNATTTFKDFYKGGKKYRAQKYKIGDNEVFYAVDPQTKQHIPIDSTFSDDDRYSKGTKGYSDRIKEARSQLATKYKEAEDRFGIDPDAKSTDPRRFYIGQGPDSLAKEFVSWAEDNGIEPDDSRALDIAATAYRQAVLAVKDNRIKRGTSSIRDFLDDQMIRESTGTQELFMINRDKFESKEEAPKYVGPVKMKAIYQKAEALASQFEGGKATKQAIFAHAVKKWGEHAKNNTKLYQKYMKSGTEKSTPFYNFLEAEFDTAMKDFAAQ